MVFTLGPSAHLPWLVTRAGIGTIFRSSGITRFVQGGVVKTFRCRDETNVMTDDAALIQRFVDYFQRLDDSTYTADEPPPAALSLGPDPNDWNAIQWAPAAIATSPVALGDLPRYESLPALYRQLVLSYRWLSVDLDIVRLLGNPPADGLQPLANLMTSDPVLQNTLAPSGYVRFALAADCYDPICFDLNRVENDDCPIIRLNHESILMHDNIGDVTTMFDTFRDLVLRVLTLERQT